MSTHDIDIVHRVQTRGDGPSNIIARFVSRGKRDQILLAAKKTRLNTGMLGFGENEPVFVNEHLCPDNKVLLGKAIRTKREKNWKFAWVADGKILMRKTEQSRAVHVTCEDDLAMITWMHSQGITFFNCCNDDVQPKTHRRRHICLLH